MPRSCLCIANTPWLRDPRDISCTSWTSRQAESNHKNMAAIDLATKCTQQSANIHFLGVL